ncbi:hypothetical protein N7G274_007190 [Stereocaulon virgatum]|uniref:F-box domain-containing protein n=1 Tax=Stereocaulon virgatum TaxID=373712 RepID=A0ABR4A2X0_9LECA
MEEFIGRLRSTSTSLSSLLIDNHGDVATQCLITTSAPPPSPQMSSLEALPAEIITHILAFLTPVDLADLSQSSHLLRSHAYNDLLWMQFVRDAIPNYDQVPSPSPAKSWRDLYVAHHPYWFLVRHKVWFADLPNTGSIIIARYNHRLGCIEGYRLIAEHGAHTFDIWEHNPGVIIHTFNPEVRLWLDDMVIKLDYTDSVNGKRLQHEISMPTNSTHGVCSNISLCQPIPKELQHPSMALWPPSIIPSLQRVRNESQNKFRDDDHKPRTLDRMSDRTFRIRKWVEFSNLMQPIGSIRMGEDVMTYSTLLEESYMPTKDKPYQGIWVGDYSGHGCEFLLVLQREVTTNTTMSRQSSTSSLPSGMTIAEIEEEAQDDSGAGFHQMSQGETVEQVYDDDERDVREVDSATETARTAASNVQGAQGSSNDQRDNWRFGRLEAIKLTGDINVPRGQYTWIAEDIGHRGLLRVGSEQMFAGARMVKSWGRIAGRGFRHDRFIPSQLIMISYDTLAQYWEDFGHISFYKRVNIDDHLNV